MSQLRASFAIFILFFVAACGRGAGPERKPPSFVHDHEDGLCGSSVELDSAGSYWSEGGCESGASRRTFQGTVPGAQLDRVTAAFAAHPDASTFVDDACDGGFTGSTETFELKAADGQVTTWTLCNVSLSYESDDHKDHFPKPFDETAAAFRALTPQ